MPWARPAAAVTTASAPSNASRCCGLAALLAAGSLALAQTPPALPLPQQKLPPQQPSQQQAQPQSQPAQKPQLALQGPAQRGQYLAAAGGCLGCHTATTKDAQPFAGGRELKTPFGTFHGPNITPHPQAGIGSWSEADFVRAMRQGRRPDGSHYFPAFPYPSFTKISDADLRDLWAYLRTLPQSAQASRAHELRFPFGWRWLVAPWKWLFFTPGPMAADPKRSAALNRGEYLTVALGHCGECHTPRNFLGGPKQSRLHGGTAKGPEGKGVPNITQTRLKKWDDAELRAFLESGLTPDGDVVGETMGEVIQNTTGKLTVADLAAMIAYLRAVPPLPDEPE